MKTIVVAGTTSGVGKTSVALGLMAAYARRGLRVQPFKVGPDFVDPLVHEAATGRPSFNLDIWMLSRDVNLACVQRFIPLTDVAIVEGAMGLYDGHDGKSDVGSTAEMAKLLGAPVLLILDCWSLSRSVAAVIRGYTSFDPGVNFAGVIFNKVGGPSHTAWLTDAILTTEPGVKVMGGVPKTTQIQLPERQFRSQTANDDKFPVSYIEKLADLMELHIDLDAVLKAATVLLANDAKETRLATLMNVSVQPSLSKHVRIGVAQDEAFCFYYHENFLLLQDAGAELVYFSPLKDSLPPRLDGVYFGGGYPELHLEELYSNKRLLYAVRAFADAGGVIFAESGGLMYLSQGIEDQEAHRWSMCGVFPFWTRMQPVLHAGYATVTPQENCVLFPKQVGEIRGHTCHFGEIYYENNSSCSKGFIMKGDYLGVDDEQEGFIQGNAMATFVHLHFSSNPAAAQSFVERCRIDKTKSAAVAAASASAVAGAGPVAAAAAGAAAAAAVAEALGEPKELCGLHHATKSEGSLSSLSLIRRSGSFDLSSITQAAYARGMHGRLVRSESELVIWDRLMGHVNHGLPRFRKDTSIENFDLDNRVLVNSQYPHSRDGNCKDTDHTSLKINSARTKHTSNVENSFCVEDTSGARIEDPVEKVPLASSAVRSEWHCNGQLHPHQNLERSDLPNKPKFPQKIVSLMPAATQIIIEIGAGHRLVGITDSCQRPLGAGMDCHTKRSLGTGKESSLRIDISWICKTQPDLIIIQDSSIHGDTHSIVIVSVLAQAGLEDGKNTSILLLRSHTVADVLASILKLGSAVDLHQEACLLVNWLRSRLRKVVQTVVKQRRSRMLLLQGFDPLVLGGMWVPELETSAGGFDGLQKPGCNAVKIVWERIINYSPEILILAPCPFSVEQTLSEVGNLASLSSFWSIPAVVTGQVYICDHSMFSYPGLQLVDAVELIAKIAHPTVTRSLQSSKLVLKLNMAKGQRCRSEELSQHFKLWEC